MSDTLDAAAPVPPSITAGIVVTLDDQILFNRAMAARPETMRRRRVWACSIILLAPMIGFIGGMLWGYLTDRERQPIADLLGDMSGADWWRTVATIAAASGLIALVALAMQLLRGPLLRWRLRRLLSQRPGIDPHDPDLRERVRATFDAEGYTARNHAGSSTISWPFVRGIEDRHGLLIITVGRKGGFILPERELSTEQADAIRAFVAHHLDRARGEPAAGEPPAPAAGSPD